VHGGEPSRQRGDQIGLRDDSEREHEIRNRQRDPSRSAARGDLEKIGKNDDAIASLIRYISKEIGLSLHSCLLLEVAYSPFGFLTCRDDFRHVRDASFLAPLFQLSLLSFGDFGHLLLLLRKRDAAPGGASCAVAARSTGGEHP
jgi:hypothetical protein